MKNKAEEKVSFEEHGKSFQQKLVKIMLTDRAFADQIGEVLKPSFMTLSHLEMVVSLLYEYKKNYNLHPSLEVLEVKVRVGLKDELDTVKTKILELIEDTRKNPIVKDTQYIKDESLDFCKKQNLKNAMKNSMQLLKTSSFDGIKKLIDNALKLGTDNNFGYDYILDFEERFQISARNPISTGWNQIDSILQGGLGEGELAVIIAPTGGGKSFVLVHLGAAALKAGKNVVHYTLELKDTIIANRYDACLTGIGLDDLRSNKEEILRKVQEVKGKLIVKEYPTKTASTQTMRNHIDKLISSDIKPDMIIVDYADILKATGDFEAKRMSLESIYEDLRAIAMEYSIPVITASQTNRTGLNAEVITMESISEAFNKCFVADFIFSLSRTVKDKQKEGGRFYIAKNRNGDDGIIFPITMQPKYAKIVVHPRQLVEDEEEKALTDLQELRQMLKEKYMSTR